MGVTNVIHLDRVRCLECGTTYVKPAAGGTVEENPGCPRCSYLGWISTAIPARSSSPSARRRFGGDRLLRPIARAH